MRKKAYLSSGFCFLLLVCAATAPMASAQTTAHTQAGTLYKRLGGLKKDIVDSKP